MTEARAVLAQLDQCRQTGIKILGNFLESELEERTIQTPLDILCNGQRITQTFTGNDGSITTIEIEESPPQWIIEAGLDGLL
jgi:hypothetical protein